MVVLVSTMLMRFLREHAIIQSLFERRVGGRGLLEGPPPRRLRVHAKNEFLMNRLHSSHGLPQLEWVLRPESQNRYSMCCSTPAALRSPAKRAAMVT